MPHLALPTRRTPVALATALLALCAACGGGDDPKPRTDTPEPASAPAVAAPAGLPGRILPLAGEPEGIVWDTNTATIAIAVRNPGALVLVDAATGQERTRIPLGGAARHLALAAPGGPVLVPAENNDRLYRVALPGGEITADDPVGRQPHDAAPLAGGGVIVGDEMADTVHVVAPDGSSRVVAGPVQPGGVASAPDGSVAVVVGVRGRRIEAYAPDGRSLGTAACGVGPSHVRAGADGLFYVADTQGGAVLIFRADAKGVSQVGKVLTKSGAPYGLAVDSSRKLLYVTLTGTNQLRSFHIDGSKLTADRTWATVRQPNDVAVDAASGRIVVAGTADGVIQMLDPAE